MIKFMKAVALRNRKIMVDLNLKLAVVAQTRKRDSVLAFRLPNDFLQINPDQPDSIEEDSGDFDTDSPSNSARS